MAREFGKFLRGEQPGQINCKNKKEAQDIGNKHIFDNQQYLMDKFNKVLERKRTPLKMDSFFKENQTAKMYFYGYIQCLVDSGLNEANEQILQILVLETFKD